LYSLTFEKTALREKSTFQPPAPVLRNVILKARSPGFLEKSWTFAKSLRKESNFVGFLWRSRLNDPDEENQPPIGYLFPVNIIFSASADNTPRSSQNHGDNNIHILSSKSSKEIKIVYLLMDNFTFVCYLLCHYLSS
jgi:hypothetical protein